MTNTNTRTHNIRLIQIGLSLLLALSLLAVAAPVKTQAATLCASYYTVKQGDTTSRIAHKFGFRWKEIARANNMPIPSKLTVGERLCIPSKSTSTTTTPSGQVTVTAVNRLITITVSGFSNRSAFNVRVRDGSASIGGWYKVGAFKVNKNSTATVQYLVPNGLRSAMYLQVCLKNGTTNELICRTILRGYK